MEYKTSYNKDQVMCLYGYLDLELFLCKIILSANLVKKNTKYQNCL